MIDDNKYGLRARRALLAGQGYAVETAQGGEAGLQKYEQGVFDLVVTDFRMPGGPSGPEVVSEIRRRDPQVPIIMLSGFAAKLGLTPHDTGADVVLTKGPTEDADLLRAIARLTKVQPARARQAAPARSAPRVRRAAAGGFAG